MNLNKYLLIFLILTIAAQTRAQDNEEVASIARTTCYGNCPYYKMKIYADGLLIYEGKQHVEKLGTHRARVSTDTVALILEKAASIDYWNLQDKYPVKGFGIIDFPVCITSVQSVLGKKTIWNRNDSPTKLVVFERYLDQLFEDIQWVKL